MRIVNFGLTSSNQELRRTSIRAISLIHAICVIDLIRVIRVIRVPKILLSFFVNKPLSDSCEESFSRRTNEQLKKRMKTTTSKMLSENVRAVLTAVAFISLVMTLSYLGWFA